MNTQIYKCDCCETRILSIRGELLHAQVPPNEMIKVADLSVGDIISLSEQLAEHMHAIAARYNLT